MTDLPQHLAVASILEHLGDPRFGFSDYYAPAGSWLLRVLSYAAQYGFVGFLSRILPLELAMRCFVFLSALAIPLGVVAILRALGKPVWLALLSVPLVYGRAFFWGFASFNLSIGVALAACALLARSRWSRSAAVGVAALSTLVVLIHPYGAALLLGYLSIWLLLGERKEWGRRAPAASPALLGTALWLEAGGQARGFGEVFSSDLVRRVAALPDAVLGGYWDPSEAWLLLGWVAVLGVLYAGGRLGASARRPRVAHHERVLGIYVLVHVALYLILPQHTATAKFVHFRHAVLAAALLPLIVPGAWLDVRPRLARGLLVAIAGAAIVNGWVHLVLFDREARSFDGVIAALPERPRIVALSFERNGRIMRTVPYVHFAAYAQAKRGGLIASTFPGLFWNLPVRLRDDAGIPPSPVSLEMRPLWFDYARFGYFYDHVLTRTGPGAGPARPRGPDFPYELVHDDPPWRLYRSLEPPGGAPE
jgi:hypothetical protein